MVSPPGTVSLSQSVWMHKSGIQVRWFELVKSLSPYRRGTFKYIITNSSIQFEFAPVSSRKRITRDGLNDKLGVTLVWTMVVPDF